MIRKWQAFDVETINREMLALTQEDKAKLHSAMKECRQNSGIGYIVKSYGNEVMMIRANDHSQGRCLFFSVSEVNGVQILTALVVYKKEKDEVPASVLKRAEKRKQDFEGR